MGLGFHIGQGGIENLGDFIGDMEMDEHSWLQKNRFLVGVKIGHLPDPVESLPYVDDVTLTHEQILRIKEIFDSRKRETQTNPGFKSVAVEKMDVILTKAIAQKKGLSTCAD